VGGWVGWRVGGSAGEFSPLLCLMNVGTCVVT